MESGNGFFPPYLLAEVYSGLGEVRQTFALLKKALEIHDTHLMFLPMDPDVREAEGGTRVQVLARSPSFRKITARNRWICLLKNPSCFASLKISTILNEIPKTLTTTYVCKTFRDISSHFWPAYRWRAFPRSGTETIAASTASMWSAIKISPQSSIGWIVGIRSERYLGGSNAYLGLQADSGGPDGRFSRRRKYFLLRGLVRLRRQNEPDIYL